MTFGQYLKSERTKLKLSVEELALKCGTSRSYLTLIENGKRLPGKKVIPNIAAALNLKNSVIINWYLEDIRQKLENSDNLQR